ncbi:MAG: DNA repair protein RecO [Candidatus Izemoplasma sp.]|nr:DNA repair protein RecO [Candidatus Izemoplasma sp.]
MKEIEGFVLQSIDYKDNHKILYLYSALGHHTLLAYNVKKMNNIQRFLSQRGSLIQYKIPEKPMAPLKDGELINAYDTIKEDPIAYTRMLHILELVRHVIDDHSNHEKMFHFIKKIFNHMNRQLDSELYQYIFELKLLHFIGYGLNFKACSICGKKTNLVFHPSSGGVICKQHVKDFSVSYPYDIYELLAHLYYIDVDHASPRNLTHKQRIQIKEIITLLYDEFVGFHTKSSKILEQMQKI